LAAVIPGPILAEYEAAVRAAGYEPGVILPSSLVALEIVNSMEAVLVANLSPTVLTTSITCGQDLLLYRTLDLPEEPVARLLEVQRGVAVAAAYYEDKLQLKPSQLYYAGPGVAFDFGQWINNLELTVEDLTVRPETGVITSLGSTNIAGVAGALAGAS
jgi:type IV pilus assembly protein PilM